jgi:hypothetical protein
MRIGIAASIALSAGLAVDCGGGGGSSGGYDRHGTLLSVEFPDPTGASDPALPPEQAPLLQQIRFAFDSRPDPNAVSSSSIAIRDEAGFPVPGRFDVDEEVVTFTPRLPTVAPAILPTGGVDVADAGLAPGARYTIRLSTSSFRFVQRIDDSLLRSYRDPTVPYGVLIGFGTTSDFSRLLDGLPPAAPSVVESTPADGAAGVSPNLYTDPDHAFPPRAPIVLRLDRPIRPDPQDLGPAGLQLIDLDDRPLGFPGGLSLAIDVRVTSNEIDGSTLELVPDGILPLGHQLAVAVAPDLQGISEHGEPGTPTTVVAAFTVAASDADTVHDDLVETFDDELREDVSPADFAPGAVQAEWDLRDSQILQAGVAFQGNGVLGRFAPPPPASGTTHIVTLDTSRQVFPLPDGSTPDAPPGYEVVGGVFSFTDVDIPASVWIEPIGPNPLVLTATGTFRLAGEIFIQGLDGTTDMLIDSAVTSLAGGPGGSGGGLGGEGHPILYFPPDQASVLNLVSPPFGGRGYGIDPADGVSKRIGGMGGQSGTIDHPDPHGRYSTDQEISCIEIGAGNDDGDKVPGGGGGSLLFSGQHPKDFKKGVLLDGIGNVLPDGQGRFIVRSISDQTLLAGDGGEWPFYDDGDSTNDFIGPTGQVRRLIGGQGGGGGGSRTESYYCGVWCRHDSDPNDDGVCHGTDFGWQPLWADSVGDARGAAGGGGGGALLIQALGAITVDTTGAVHAYGGNGGGGETAGYSTWGSSGAGGSGGSVLLQSGTSVVIRSGALIDVSGGAGATATKTMSGLAIGAGGNGGAGLIQLQVPTGGVADVEDTASLVPLASWVDPQNVKNPSAFSPDSVAISTWWDLGRTIARPPLGATPSFLFSGLDTYGYVPTDSDGNVLDPAALDVICDDLGTLDPLTRQYLPGRQPRSDFIPPGCRIRVEFQGGDAVVAGSHEVDPASFTSWSPNAAIGNGHQFLRWRITFTIADDSHPLGPLSPRPVVQQVTVHAGF